MDHAVYLSPSVDPYRNLAIEEALCRACDGVILYLWQNRDTVVIGKNQNALRECDLAAMRRDGVRLARRTTGGGAVFHDDGNLNFSVIFPSEVMDKTVGYGIIRAAVDSLGIPTEVSGRNDITVDGGRKFSGNAFRLADGVCLHHGTVLVSSALERMGAYLNPTVEKLRSHGVESVRARVANLSELKPLSVEDVRQAMIQSFQAMYGPCPVKDASDDAATAELQRLFGSDEWLYGREPAADIILERRFGWGGLTLMLATEKGVIARTRAYTDSMDPTLAETLEACLTGRRLRPGELSGAVRNTCLPEAEGISSWLRNLSF